MGNKILLVNVKNLKNILHLGSQAVVKVAILLSKTTLMQVKVRMSHNKVQKY